MKIVGDRRGFTLTEVLVAAMILLIALLSIASMFPVGYRQITDAGRMTMRSEETRLNSSHGLLSRMPSSA